MKEKTTARKPTKDMKTAQKQAPTKQTQRKTSSAKPKESYMLVKSDIDRAGNQRYTAHRVYEKMPKGWKEIDVAKTAPHGYKWISNGKSALFGGRRTALIRK